MAEKLVVLEEFVITTHFRFQSPYGDLESGDLVWLLKPKYRCLISVSVPLRGFRVWRPPELKLFQDGACEPGFRKAKRKVHFSPFPRAHFNSNSL